MDDRAPSLRAELLAGATAAYIDRAPRRFDLRAVVTLDVWTDSRKLRKKPRQFDARLDVTLENLPFAYKPSLKVVGSIEEGYDIVASAPHAGVKSTVHSRSLSPRGGPVP